RFAWWLPDGGLLSEQFLVHGGNGFRVLLHLIKRRNPAPKGMPEVRRVGCFTNDLSEVGWVADPKVQAVHAVDDFLCHAADVAADHRLAVGECLLNDER